MSDERCKHGKHVENPCVECDEEKSERQSSLAAPDGSVLERGVTHPQIHMDFYEWSMAMNEQDREYFNRAVALMINPVDVMMWAWTRSRETLKAKAQNAKLTHGDERK